MDFLLELKLNWRQNAGVRGNDGTSFQSYLFPKTSTPIAFIFLKQLCLVASVPRIFFIILVRRKLEKFENHWPKLSLNILT